MLINILYYLQLIFSLILHQPHYTNHQENHHIWIKMATSKRLFTVQCPHGPGGVFFAWQRASGGYLATTGYDQIVNIYNRYDSFLFIFVIVWILEDIDIRCGLVSRILKAKQKLLILISKTLSILLNFQKWQCAGPQKQIHKSSHISFVFWAKKL